jgi:hypothetical protein
MGSAIVQSFPRAGRFQPGQRRVIALARKRPAIEKLAMRFREITLDLSLCDEIVGKCTRTAARVWQRLSLEGNVDQQKFDREIDIPHFMGIAPGLEAFKLPGLD